MLKGDSYNVREVQMEVPNPKVSILNKNTNEQKGQPKDYGDWACQW